MPLPILAGGSSQPGRRSSHCPLLIRKQSCDYSSLNSVSSLWQEWPRGTRTLVWVPDLERLVTIKAQEEEDVIWCLWRRKQRAISYFGLPQNRRNAMNYVFILKYSNLPHTIILLIKLCSKWYLMYSYCVTYIQFCNIISH